MGLVLIGIAAREAVHQRRLWREGVRTEGLVVRHRRSSGGEGGSVSFAVVNFVDVQGRPHEFEVGAKGLAVGGQAPVVYLPGAPETARVDLSSKRRASFGLLLVGGIGFMVAAIEMLPTGR
jgi:hypothetical protein